MSTYAHEFSHILGIGDNYNNPYSVPARRAYSGPWEMLDRGTFNGPGRPAQPLADPARRRRVDGRPAHAAQQAQARHRRRGSTCCGCPATRWPAPASWSRRVTARAVPPAHRRLTGVNVALDGGDRSPACDPSADPLCDGGGYDNYTVEVVDRMGFDSFTPDSGVLLAKTKNADAAPFIWTVDANPQDIDKVDFVRPDGTPEKMTIGDYRQLSDALFHAGTDSGSEYEYVDQANRLHFYVLDVRRDRARRALVHRRRAVARRRRRRSGAACAVRPATAAAPRPGRWARCMLAGAQHRRGARRRRRRVTRRT